MMRGPSPRTLVGVPVSMGPNVIAGYRAARPPWLVTQTANYSSSSAVTTASVNVEPGDLIVILGFTGQPSFSDATLSNGDTVTQILEAAAGNTTFQVAYAVHTGAAGSTTATVTASGVNVGAYLLVIRGADPDAPILQDPTILGATTATGTLTLPAFTVTEAYALALAIGACNDDNTPTTPNTDWTFYSNNLGTSRASEFAVQRLHRGRTTTSLEIQQSANGPDAHAGYRMAIRASAR